MRLLAALVTLLLVQSLSAILIDEHTRSQPVYPIFPGKYLISDTTLKGSKGTSVDFTKTEISFHRGCNAHWTTYKSDVHHFSVSEDWSATRKGCRTAQYQLDSAIVKLINEADSIRSTHPSSVRFYKNSKWLFTITRRK